MPVFRPLCLLVFLAGPLRAASPPLPERAAQLREYVHHQYPCHITSVTVGPEQIRIAGTVSAGQKGWAVAEITPLGNAIEPTDFTPMTPQTGSHLTVMKSQGGPHRDGDPVRPEELEERFTLVVPRPGPDHPVDRLFSRWAVVNGAELLSDARYASEVQPVRPPPPPRAPFRTRKGLGGYHLANPQEDIDELGISGVTVNVMLGSFMRSGPGEGRTPFTYMGRTWYTDDKAVAGLDRTITEAAKHHLTVSAIILVPRPPSSAADTTSYNRLVAHPDNNGGIFAMPNLTSAEGLNAYAAAMDYLAARYTQADGAHGRIHDWIMFNEVDSAFSWANAGDKPDWVYDDLLVKCLRIAHLIVQQYDPGAAVFVSLDQHWTASPGAHCFPGKTVLEQISDFCAAEGDFPWAVAHHPYPQSLVEPKVWENNQATFSFNSPKITYKNLEVLNAFLDLPRLQYLGKKRRRLQLTEQGLNSKDYSDEQLQLQAAGMAYAWNKMKRLPGIEVFDYHNWIDNRHEGGLRIGLRRFRDDETDPLGRKPVWYVFQALGTPGEAAATDFAKPLIGITDWEEIMHKEAIK